MSSQKCLLEISDNNHEIVFSLVFEDTGEIKQKRRSRQWLFERVFQHEYKRWQKQYKEEPIQIELFSE